MVIIWYTCTISTPFLNLVDSRFRKIISYIFTFQMVKHTIFINIYQFRYSSYPAWTINLIIVFGWEYIMVRCEKEDNVNRFICNLRKRKLYGSRKYPYSPHRRDWNFLGVRASMRTKNLKKCMKLNWNFRRGGEVLEKSLPGGGMDIFWNHTIHKNRLLVHAVFRMHHLNTFWSIIIIHCILKK